MDDIHFVAFDEFYSNDPLKPEVPHLKELKKTFLNDANINPAHIHSPLPSLSADKAASGFSELVKVRQPELLIVGIGTNGVIGWNFSETPRDIGLFHFQLLTV